jgi:hypothetical protein
MSFSRWQKLIAASTEKAVVAACCEAVVDDALKTIGLGVAQSLADEATEL